MAVWTDLKEAIDHIQRQHNRPMYLYACSLGAICANIYLTNLGRNTPIKAAAFYGTPINPFESSKFFVNNLYGFYNYVLGRNLISRLSS
jgi:predicted alpha/beta-fold hydrolase